MLDPFHVLGIEKDAKTDEVHRAYRKKAAKHHPDAGGDAWAFKCVQQAYDSIISSRDPKQAKPSRPKQPDGNKPTRAKPEGQPKPKPKTKTSAKSQANPESARRANPQGTAQTKSTRQSNANRKPHATATKQEAFSTAKLKSWWNSSKSLFKTRERPPNQTTTARSTADGARPEGPQGGENSSSSSSHIPFWVRHLLTGHLPMQTEVSVFVLVGVLDIVMTNLLLRHGAVEANPIARFFLRHWGFHGMIAFKMLSILFVIVIAQIVAQFRMSSARRVLYIGTAIVGCVVSYSAVLLLRKL